MKEFKNFEGDLIAKGIKFGLVVGRFNEFISKKLLDGALDALVRHGLDDGAAEIVWVPGSLEISLAAKKMAESGKYDALICLGAVIRGGTPHFDYVSSEVMKGLAKVSLDMGVPVANGVLTTDTIEQAVERAGTKAGNKGWNAALSAIEMANLLEGMKTEG